MKRLSWILLGLVLLGCQAQSPTKIELLDGGASKILESDSATPALILAQAGITLAGTDRILFHGADLPADFKLPPGSSYQLQIRRSHSLTLITPHSKQTLITSADNVGQALTLAGFNIFTADMLLPPSDTRINSDLTVTYTPARDLHISLDGSVTTIKSSAATVGQALASAGISLNGLDKSQPDDTSPLPTDGNIRVIRVSERLELQETHLPFTKNIVYTTSLPSGTQKVVQQGMEGSKISRVRVRFEDGVEVNRVIETSYIARSPTPAIINIGTLVAIQTLSIPGGQIEFWRAVQMYATSYSPCRSGTSKCSYGTASGMPVKHGVVALIPSLYNQLAGTRVYIPGYGVAVIADVGGGFPDGRPWIDLGFSDSDYETWSGMVTVYFLAPAPPSIPLGLN